LNLDKSAISDTDELKVTVDVTNTGLVAGKEVVQLYVSDCESSVIRPLKELKGFEKVELAPGETKTVSFTLDRRAFAYWNTKIKDWHVETGEFKIIIGKSAEQIELQKTVTVTGTVRVPVTFSWNSTFGDIMADPKGSELFAPIVAMMKQGMGISEESAAATNSAVTTAMLEAMLRYMPIRVLRSFGGGRFDEAQFQMLIDALNRE